ncbi:MAG: hypothetical protein GF408_07530 [Candidatus Omnitrophica bacterium]|nr:hypothetical protein [Candidatus Omnitrophota bacterium]
MIKKYSNIQIVFLASMVAFDFAFGMIVKNILAPTGVLDFIRIDMIVPVMLMMTVRLTLDRFGTLILYELAWGMLAVVAMPTAYGLPGLMKLVPAICQGIAYDAVMSGMRNMRTARIYAAAILGGAVSWIAVILMKIAMGVPWATATKIVFSVQVVMGMIVSAAGAYAAILLWERIEGLHLVRRIQCAEQ